MYSEFRFAARALARWRGGAVVAALTLAIGIGTTTGLYALVRVLLADLPGVPELDRLARVYASSQTLGVERSQVTLNEFDSTLSTATSFAAVGAYAAADVTIGTGQDVQPVIGGYASPAFFTAMGVTPAAGRVFTSADVTSSQPVVILSHTLYRRQFPDQRHDHATIIVDGVERAVIGVMPPEFRYEFVGMTADLWIPLARASHNMPAIVAVYGRLRDGAGWPAADAELRALARGREPWTWRAIPVNDDVRHRAVGAYAGTLGPAVLVLLIACVNVACMLLARGIEREKELSVRRALGATRLRVIRLLLTENLLLALVSGVLGGALAIVILRVLGAAFAAVQPTAAAKLAVDMGLLPVAIATSALACVLFGMVPALRLSKRDVAASLNGVPAAHKIEIAGYGGRDAIVFAEIASAVGLIVWTAMLYTLFAQVGRIRFTFPADRMVAMRVPAAEAHDVELRAAAVPGVTRTAISSAMLGGGSRIRVEADGARAAVMSRMPVGDGFLETLGVPLIRGRSFDASELHGGVGVAILSETGARQLAPDGNAIGMRLKTSDRQSVVVIGICGDAIDYGALSKAEAYAPAAVYVPYEPSAMVMDVVVLARLSTDPHAALRAIAAAAQTPPGRRPARPVILSDEIGMRGPNGAGAVLITRILGSFSILTLLLAASGVFAVIGQSVAQRTREFGIRLALGAPPRRVLGMVLARETKLIGTAIVVGVIFTMALTRALFVELARLSAIVPGTWIAALVLAGGVAAVSVLLATYRIVRLEPSVVLRRL
jgi:putative ABC transport system permease protein